MKFDLRFSSIVLPAVFSLTVALCAHATTVSEFERRSPEAKYKLYTDTANSFIRQISASKPELGERVREFFFGKDSIAYTTLLSLVRDIELHAATAKGASPEESHVEGILRAEMYVKFGPELNALKSK